MGLWSKIKSGAKKLKSVFSSKTEAIGREGQVLMRPVGADPKINKGTWVKPLKSVEETTSEKISNAFYDVDAEDVIDSSVIQQRRQQIFDNSIAEQRQNILNKYEKLSSAQAEDVAETTADFTKKQGLSNAEKFGQLTTEEQATIASQYGYNSPEEYAKALQENKVKIPLEEDVGTKATKPVQGTENIPKPVDNIQAAQQKLAEAQAKNYAEVKEGMDEAKVSVQDASLEANKNQGTPDDSTGPKLSSHAALAVGALSGVGLTYALTRNRGQQSNAQLYGQQPLY